MTGGMLSYCQIKEFSLLSILLLSTPTKVFNSSGKDDDTVSALPMSPCWFELVPSRDHIVLTLETPCNWTAFLPF